MPSGGTIHIGRDPGPGRTGPDARRRAEGRPRLRDLTAAFSAPPSARTSAAASDVAQPHPSIRITSAPTAAPSLDMGRLDPIISEACEGLAEVDGALIERETPEEPLRRR